MFASMDFDAQLLKSSSSFRGGYVVYIRFYLRTSFQISSYEHKSGVFLCRFNGQINFSSCVKTNSRKLDVFFDGFLFITHCISFEAGRMTSFS